MRPKVEKDRRPTWRGSGTRLVAQGSRVGTMDMHACMYVQNLQSDWITADPNATWANIHFAFNPQAGESCIIYHSSGTGFRIIDQSLPRPEGSFHHPVRTCCSYTSPLLICSSLTHHGSLPIRGVHQRRTQATDRCERGEVPERRQTPRLLEAALLEGRQGRGRGGMAVREVCEVWEFNFNLLHAKHICGLLG